MLRLMILVSFTILLTFPLFSQESEKKSQEEKRVKVVNEIVTFDVKVKVIGVLQGQNSMAVIQVIETKENKWGLNVGDEVLCKFYFGTAPYQGETYYPGVKGGEILKAQIEVKKNRNNVQNSYSILRYKVIGEEELQKPSGPKH